MKWSQFIRDTATFATAYNTYQTSKKLDNLNKSLDDFKDQTSAELSKLIATMDMGFSMLSMELAVQSQIFKNILNVLKEKRKTEAEELKNFGLKALRNGWIKDAIDDFKKSIEINRYDYQVYYLLSKCYFIENNIEKQDHYLQMAFQYSSEDSMFRQYVGLDIVGQLVKEKKFDEAREVVKYLEGLLDEAIELTPLLMSKIYIDVCTKNVTDQTLQLIDKAIDNYDGEEPSRVITVIKVLSHYLDKNQQLLIENKLNLKKFVITQKYGSNVITYLNNIEKTLIFIYTNSDRSAILKVLPEVVTDKYFPLYKSIPLIIDRIREFKNRISKLGIDDFDKFNFISPILQRVEKNILDDVSDIYNKNDEKDFNSEPFQQSIQPELNFNVGQDDKILVQCKLSNNELITLTYFKLIIIDKNKNTFVYDLLDDFLNVEKSEIRVDNVAAYDKQTDLITFYLRDKLSEKILMISTSSYFTQKYGNKDWYANVLRLLWSRAANNILIYIDLKNFNSHLSLLNLCMDYIGVSNSSSTVQFDSNNEVEFIDSSNSDVEFIN